MIITNHPKGVQQYSKTHNKNRNLGEIKKKIIDLPAQISVLSANGLDTYYTECVKKWNRLVTRDWEQRIVLKKDFETISAISKECRNYSS